jgi:hypothetical protein
MAEMWKRIKVWLIKKLGGYATDDVRVRHEFFPQQTKNIVVLRVEGTYLRHNAPPLEWMEGKLLEELAMQLKPHVLWEENENYTDYLEAKRTVRATVKVVADNGRT